MNTADAQKYLLNITTFSQRGQSGSGDCITSMHTANLRKSVENMTFSKKLERKEMMPQRNNSKTPIRAGDP